MLTFEYDSQHNVINIFADTNGLELLQQEVYHLLEGSSHTHLMTSSWGGNELSETKQLESTMLIHQVNINRI